MPVSVSPLQYLQNRALGDAIAYHEDVQLAPLAIRLGDGNVPRGEGMIATRAQFLRQGQHGLDRRGPQAPHGYPGRPETAIVPIAGKGTAKIGALAYGVA
jgi:hypothetical protein